MGREEDNKYKRAWYQMNKKRERAKQKTYWAATRDERLEQKRKYYQENAEEIIEKQRRRRAGWDEARKDLERAKQRARYHARKKVVIDLVEELSTLVESEE